MNFTDLQYCPLVDEDGHQSTRVRRYQVPAYYFSLKKGVTINDEYSQGIFKLRVKSTFSSTLIFEDMNGK